MQSASQVKPKGQEITRESVKTLAIAVGVREAARQLGLSEERVMKWSQREKWLKNELKPQPPTVTRNEVRAVRKPSEVLAEYGKTTRFHLAKATDKASEHISEQSPDFILAKSEDLRRVVSSAAQIHGWDEKKDSAGINLSILSIGGDMAVQVKQD